MIAVVGAGAWGTALAQTVAAGGERVLIWAREPEVVEDINQRHANPTFLPGVALPPEVRATGELAALAGCDLWLVVVPAQHLRSVLRAMPTGARPTLVLCAKGIEGRTGLLPSEVTSEEVPGSRIAVLSGPSFAAEVAAGKPTAVTLAARDIAEAEDLSARLARPTFRPYASDDIIGAGIGGAVKNVIAIGCGVVVGAGLGESARAALVARGFAEMTRFAVARGGRAETLAGLSGLGDLVLTCGSAHSRNMALGLALGRGLSATEALAGQRTVVEGAATAPALVAAARAVGVEMPIAEAVAALLAGTLSVEAAMSSLLSRPLRREDGPRG
ncbi:NAD(P)H-dependent glycerol-3-phosphate dehydrogenase [Thermaurantiacus sp.]